MPDPDDDLSGAVVDTTSGRDKAAPVALSEPMNPQRVTDAPETDHALQDIPAAGPIDEPPVPPAPRAAVRPAPRRRGGFLALLLGGALAAAGGFALARYTPGGWPIADTSALDARIGEVTIRVDQLDAALADLQRPAAPDTGLADRISALEAAGPVASPTVDLAPLEARLAALESAPRATATASGAAPPSASAPGAAPEIIAALDARIAAIEARVADGSTDGSAAAARIEELAASATARIAQAEERAEVLRTRTEAATRNATLRAALGRLQAALETGAPFASAVTEIAAAGVEVPPDLSASGTEGVPTLSALQAAFPDAARAALAASTRATMGEGLTDRMTAFLRTQTGARSLTPREGTEPDAILSRAEAALRTGDLATVLAELAALPPEGQAELGDWVAMATRRVLATDGAVALSAALDAG